MLLYPAIISADRTNASEYYSPYDYVKVRIPQFHGVESPLAYQNVKDANGNPIEISHTFCPEEDLPWAILQRGFSDRYISAECLLPGDIVYVILENNDVNTPIITGYASRFQFTDDPSVAELNRTTGGIVSYYGGVWPDGSYSFGNFGEASSVISTALSQVGTGEYGTNKTKYNDEFGGAGYQCPWCCIFVWWVFKHTIVNNESCSKYFYDGKQTDYCPTLMQHYKDKGQFITSGFKAGDIVFFDWDGTKKRCQHVGIVIEDQINPNDSIKTVEGNVSDKVVTKTRSMSLITGGARLSSRLSTDITSGSTETQVFNFLTRALRFNNRTFNNAVACGIMANIEKESSFNPNCYGDSSTSYGLCQWHNDRFTKLKKFCKDNNYDYTSVTGQMYYLQKELTSDYSSMLNSLLSLPNTEYGVAEAAKQWCIKFEVPKDKEKKAESRANTAKTKYWPKYRYN